MGNSVCGLKRPDADALWLDPGNPACVSLATALERLASTSDASRPNQRADRGYGAMQGWGGSTPDLETFSQLVAPAARRARAVRDLYALLATELRAELRAELRPGTPSQR